MNRRAAITAARLAEEPRHRPVRFPGSLYPSAGSRLPSSAPTIATRPHPTNPDIVGMTADNPGMPRTACHVNTYAHYQLVPAAHGQCYMLLQDQMALMPARVWMPQGSQLHDGLPLQQPGTAVSGVGEVQATTAMHPPRQKEEKKAATAASKRLRSKSVTEKQLKRIVRDR